MSLTRDHSENGRDPSSGEGGPLDSALPRGSLQPYDRQAFTPSDEVRKGIGERIRPYSEGKPFREVLLHDVALRKP